MKNRIIILFPTRDISRVIFGFRHKYVLYKSCLWPAMDHHSTFTSMSLLTKIFLLIHDGSYRYPMNIQVLIFPVSYKKIRVRSFFYLTSILEVLYNDTRYSCVKRWSELYPKVHQWSYNTFRIAQDLKVGWQMTRNWLSLVRRFQQDNGER